jgi:hypothetical protein
MSEKELAAQLATALAEKDEAVALAVDRSMKLDEALGLLGAATAAVVNGAAPAKPEAPAPTPAPVPFVPAPASFNEWMSMPSAQKAAVIAAHGPDVEERLYNEKMNNIRIGSASRGGFSGGLLTIPEKLGGAHVLTAKERAAMDVAGYSVGAPRPIPRGTIDVAAANLAALNAGLGWGAPKAAAKAAAPKAAPAPSGTAAPGQKSRHLGGFGIRK